MFLAVASGGKTVGKRMKPLGGDELQNHTYPVQWRNTDKSCMSLIYIQSRIHYTCPLKVLALLAML